MKKIRLFLIFFIIEYFFVFCLISKLKGEKMKKIAFLIIIAFALVGFSGGKTEDKVINVNNEAKQKKEYYVSVVPYVDHDDYYKNKYTSYGSVNVTPTKNEVKEDSKKEVAIEENIAISDYEFVLEDKNKTDEISVEDQEENQNEANFEDEQVIIKDEVSQIEEENDETIEQDNDTGLKEPVIEEPKDEVNEEIKPLGYYSPNGKYLGDTKVKVIDVSYYQGDINWDTFVQESDCYGVILRLGYWNALDKKFERNINEIKRLNIPYGIYLFSYSTTLNGALTEARFTNEMIDKYNLNPTLGIYYDIESWSSSNGSSSNTISKEQYDKIISTYVTNVSNHVGNRFKVRVYSGRWYAMNRLGTISKAYVDWVAEYNSTCKYDGKYSMWQYTSKGSVPGISGNVDISYLY